MIRMPSTVHTTSGISRLLAVRGPSSAGVSLPAPFCVHRGLEYRFNPSMSSPPKILRQMFSHTFANGAVPRCDTDWCEESPTCSSSSTSSSRRLISFFVARAVLPAAGTEQCGPHGLSATDILRRLMTYIAQ